MVLGGFPAAGPRGLAAGLKPEVRRPQLALATLLAALVAIGAAGWIGLGLGALAGTVVLLGGRFATARLGGVTGDICGGLGQSVEAATLVAAVAVMAGR